MTTTPVVEGWTKTLEYELRGDGAPVAITGQTVELLLTDKDSQTVSTTGKVVNQDDGSSANKGFVGYNPASGDLLAVKSPYSMRWKLTDLAGKIAFWPSGPNRDVLTVSSA